MKRFLFAACLSLLTVILLAPPAYSDAEQATEDTEQAVQDAEQAAEPQCPVQTDEADKKKKGQWERMIAAGFTYNEGNTDNSLLNIKVNIDREKKRNIWIFEFEESYGKDNDEKTIDYTMGNAEYKRLLNKHLYVGAGLHASQDEIANVDYRVRPNLVIGYFVIRKENIDLAAEIGPAYVFEKLGGVEDDYFAPRIGDRFEYRISDTSKLYQKADFIVSAEDTEKYLIEAEAGVEARLNSYLSLIFSVKDLYDNQPAEDSKRNDLSVITSLGVHF